ncbi:probable serine/threonine-protein kinase samkC [Eriocheir sinensis]|uniref:probable serine/threonine-protein kinase samkC n=1 Tax=Eriocheir sinensis TaxID=95602 RepID=UPI0021C89F65|nr:probable serine/threonine-protein kinase samkC [Eriocheir sinensis]
MAALTLNRTRSLARRALPYGRSEVRVNLDLASTLLAEAVEDFKRTWSFDPTNGVPLVGIGRVLWVPESSFQPNPAQSSQKTQVPAQTPRKPQELPAQCVQKTTTQEFHAHKTQELQAQSRQKPQDSPAQCIQKQQERPAQCIQKPQDSPAQCIQKQQESPVKRVQKTATQEFPAQRVQKTATPELPALKSTPNPQLFLLLASRGREENKENSGRRTGCLSVAEAGDSNNNNSNNNSSNKRKTRGGRGRGGDGARLRQTCITDFTRPRKHRRQVHPFPKPSQPITGLV